MVRKYWVHKWWLAFFGLNKNLIIGFKITKKFYLPIELQQHDTMAQLANNQLTGQQNNQQYFAQIITADVVPITEQQQHMDTTFEQQSTLDNARSANNQGIK